MYKIRSMYDFIRILPNCVSLYFKLRYVPKGPNLASVIEKKEMLLLRMLELWSRLNLICLMCCNTILVKLLLDKSTQIFIGFLNILMLDWWALIHIVLEISYGNWIKSNVLWWMDLIFKVGSLIVKSYKSKVKNQHFLPNL